MSFGFSAGDFLAALELVGTVVRALRDSGGSSAQYREIVSELDSLETALLLVKQLEDDEDQRPEYVALRHTAAQCQHTVGLFLKSISKYHKHLKDDLKDGAGGIASVKSAWMKIQWTLCKENDVAKFKAALHAHTESINLVLSAIQIHKISLESKKSENQFSSLSAAIQNLSMHVTNRIADATSGIAFGAVQADLLLGYAANIVNINIRIFQMVCNLQNIITNIPAQVERQQPVFLIDAIGRTAPFHLEFIRSADALKAVLKANFQNIIGAPRKIVNNEFLIQETASKRVIDLSRDWDSCFLPGQKADMSMIFRTPITGLKSCPVCQSEVGRIMDLDIECPSCGAFFHRSNSKSAVAVPHAIRNLEAGSEEQLGSPYSSESLSRESELDLIAQYRRVRLEEVCADILLEADRRGQTVEFNQAMAFINKVKDRFLADPEIYKTFLEILQVYQRESTPIRAVYEQITFLLESAPDLIDGFHRFLPEMHIQA